MTESALFPTTMDPLRLIMTLAGAFLLYQWYWQFLFYRKRMTRKSRRDRLATLPFLFFVVLSFIKGWRLEVPDDWITWGLLITCIVLNISIGARLTDDFETGPTPWQKKLTAYWNKLRKRDHG